MIATALERVLESPFLATRTGRLLAWLLRAQPLPREHSGRYRLYEVPWLPGVGFLPSGQTWGETILVRIGQHSPRLVVHEACHAEQFRRLTSAGFLALYTWQWLAGLWRYRDLYQAYWQMPLEREARAATQAASSAVVKGGS